MGDLDADGDLDIVVSNGGSGLEQPETIWLNDGVGNFAPHPTTPAIGAGRASAARLGDLDNDGDLDVLVSNSNNAAQTVWLNEPLSLFVTATDPTGNGVEIAQNGVISATFSRPISTTTVTSATFTTRGEQTGIYTGTYSFPNWDQAQFDASRAFKPGEVIVTTLSQGVEAPNGPTLVPFTWQFRAAVSGGSGMMIPHPTTPQFGAGSSRGIAIGDLDNDGDLDAVVGNTANQAETVWLNDGIGNFSPHPTVPSFGGGYTQDVDLGDLDSDGDLDAVIINADLQAHTVWLNDGNGVFSLHPTTPTFGENWYSFAGALGDIDGDGDLDLLVAEGGTFNNAENVWLNNGTGGFSPHTTTPTFGGGISRDITLGDLDKDGDLDAIVTHDGSASTVWLNDGDGNYSAHPSIPNFGGTGVSYGVTLGDIDGDADLDVAIAGWEELETIWVNDDTGGLTPHPNTPSFDAGDRSHDVVFGDFDADGDLDLLVSNAGPNTIWVNDGAGNFTLGPGGSFGGGSSYETVAGDIDNDGDLDVLFANITDQPETVWLNQNQADLAISKSSEPDTIATPGNPLTYTVSFTNLGPQTATGIIITDVVPAEVIEIDYVSSLPITPTGTVSYTWLLPDLSPGEAGTITITGIVDPVLTELLTFTNTAYITGTSFDASLVNNTSSVVLEINIAPTAVNDSGLDYTTDEDTAFTTGSVLYNDFDPNGEALSVESYNASGLLGTLTSNGDGTFDYDPDGQFEYLAAGEQAQDIFVYVVSDGVLTDTATVTITINGVNDPPLAIDDSGVDYTTDEDSTFTTGNVLDNDVDPEDDQLSVASYDASSLLGILTSNGDGTFDYDPDGQFEDLFLGEEAFDVFTYIVTDDVLTDTATVTITVIGANDNPFLDAGPDQTVDEGDLVQFQGTASDPGLRLPSSVVGLLWDFGDGTTATGTLTPTHTYLDNASPATGGAYTVTLTVTDTHGGVASDGLLVTVENVSPTLSALPDQETFVGEVITVTGTFSDPGTLDTHIGIVDWGDGTVEAVGVNQASSTVSGTHAYAIAGIYTATLTLSDDDGGVTTTTFTVTVDTSGLIIYLPIVTWSAFSPSP